MAHEKEPVEKTHCLFHQKTDCICVYPVTSRESLSERLKHHIGLNELLNRHEPDAAKKEKRDQENIVYESRLNDLK